MKLLAFLIFLGVGAALPVASAPHFQGRLLSTGTAHWQGLQWSLAAANVPAAWKYTTGKGATICTVDTGASSDSPDIQVAEGFNAVTRGASWEDLNGHGTHVAGIAVGKGVLVRGVAPDATLKVANVFGSDDAASDSTVTSGLSWCISHGADVVNMSLGGKSDGYDGIAPFIRDGCKKGVDFAVAAGNNAAIEPQDVPANIHSACLITVEAGQKDGVLATFSNYGENPRSIVAPGVDIVSDWLNGGVASASGTSMASPLVAGALALLRSEGLSAQQAVRVLLSTAHFTKTMTKTTYGHGRIDVGAAVQEGHS